MTTPDRPDNADENATLAMSCGSVACYHGEQRRPAMILMPILRATPDLASARAALDAAEVPDSEREAARALLDSILVARNSPHPRPPRPR